MTNSVFLIEVLYGIYCKEKYTYESYHNKNFMLFDEWLKQETTTFKKESKKYSYYLK